MENQGKIYDLVADQFASNRNTLYSEKTYLDLMLERLPRHASILDVGCGTGYPISSYLIQHGYSVTGIDASLALLKYAQESLPRMTCIYGDMRYVDLSPTYDAVIAWDSSNHLPKEDQIYMLSRFSSWLKPNGILLFTSGEAEMTLTEKVFGATVTYYSLTADFYKQLLRANHLKALANDRDQVNHLIWLAKKESVKEKVFLFRPISSDDIPLISKWYNQEHVRAFYSLKEWQEEEVFAKLTPHIDSESSVNGYIIITDNIPIGYIQTYKVTDYPWPNQALSKDVIEQGVGLDVFIGESDFLGKKLSHLILQQFLEKRIWPEYKYCLVDPNVQNKAAIRAYEKCGFQEHKIIDTTNALKQPSQLKLMVISKLG